jgi:hypothetical protein
VTGLWFSLGTPVSSTNKSDRLDSGVKQHNPEKYHNPHGQLKENLFLLLFNMNFISKLEIYAGKGTKHFDPLEDYRFFHHWFSGVKTP